MVGDESKMQCLHVVSIVTAFRMQLVECMYACRFGKV